MFFLNADALPIPTHVEWHKYRTTVAQADLRADVSTYSEACTRHVPPLPFPHPRRPDAMATAYTLPDISPTAVKNTASLVRIVALALISGAAIASRLFAVINFESIIHELYVPSLKCFIHLTTCSAIHGLTSMYSQQLTCAAVHK